MTLHRMVDGVKVDMTPEEEAATLAEWAANAPTAAQIANAPIKAQIAALEAKQTPRRVREGGAWLKDLDAQIAVLRAQLQ